MKASDIGVNLDNKTESLLESLVNHATSKSKEQQLEARSSHVIQAAINLLESISKTCTEEDAEYLERKFFNSIKTRDPAKFSRMLRKIKTGER